MEIVKCKNCGKLFQAPKYQHRKYCSLECAYSHKRFEKKCAFCGKPFVSSVNTAKYCSSRCFRRVQDMRWRKDYQRNWFRDHPEKTRDYRRRCDDKHFVLWGHKSHHHFTDPLVIQSELFVANQILPNHGFSDITLAREFCSFFPFDILCRKNGQVCLVDVTLAARKGLNRRIIPLVKFLNAKVFVCHVKCDFTIAFLEEVNIDKKLYSSCIREFKTNVKDAPSFGKLKPILEKIA